MVAISFSDRSVPRAISSIRTWRLAKSLISTFIWGSACSAPLSLSPFRLVRSLTDLAPNAWLLWEWIDAVLARFTAHGYSDAVLAGSSDSLIERLRADLERERDRMAQAVFERLVVEGRIEFCLRADKADYELPRDMDLPIVGTPRALSRSDARAIEKRTSSAESSCAFKYLTLSKDRTRVMSSTTL